MGEWVVSRPISSQVPSPSLRSPNWCRSVGVEHHSLLGWYPDGAVNGCVAHANGLVRVVLDDPFDPVVHPDPAELVVQDVAGHRHVGCSGVGGTVAVTWAGGAAGISLGGGGGATATAARTAAAPVSRCFFTGSPGSGDPLLPGGFSVMPCAVAGTFRLANRPRRGRTGQPVPRIRHFTGGCCPHATCGSRWPWGTGLLAVTLAWTVRPVCTSASPDAHFFWTPCGRR